jgi:1,4-dihydroxy-6-naphthoate synthase
VSGRRLIRLGHSPDPDDAFMFYALAEELIPTDGFRFEHVLRDIETLNDWAREGRLEVTALSVHAYAYLSDRYRLLPHGASMGERYGPVVVVRDDADVEPADLPRLRVAVPGRLTSAFLQLQLAVGRIDDPLITPFDRILDVVEAGGADAGLVIHEGQLTYARQGLRAALDLGEWWDDLTGGLPLPLGANAVRRDLDEGDTLPRLSRLLRDSIAYGLEHRAGALAHAERFGRGLDRGLADRFVGMYVNDRTLDYGEDGRAAVAELLRRGHEAGLLDRAPPVDFVED